MAQPERCWSTHQRGREYVDAGQTTEQEGMWHSPNVDGPHTNEVENMWMRAKRRTKKECGTARMLLVHTPTRSRLCGCGPNDGTRRNVAQPERCWSTHQRGREYVDAGQTTEQEGMWHSPNVAGPHTNEVENMWMRAKRRTKKECGTARMLLVHTPTRSRLCGCGPNDGTRRNVAQPERCWSTHQQGRDYVDAGQTTEQEGMWHSPNVAGPHTNKVETMWMRAKRRNKKECGTARTLLVHTPTR